MKRQPTDTPTPPTLTPYQPTADAHQSTTETRLAAYGTPARARAPLGRALASDIIADAAAAGFVEQLRAEGETAAEAGIQDPTTTPTPTTAPNTHT